MMFVRIVTTEFKSGFVAVVGAPNAGKSTLVNAMVGQKVAIVTSRPQTTRNRIRGIVNRPNAQIVMIDTPGMHRAGSALGRQMMGEVDAALDGIDAVAYMIDAQGAFAHVDRRATERVGRFDGPRILLLNKIDRIDKESLLPLIEAAGKHGNFSEIIPISALTGDGIDRFTDTLIKYLPTGTPYFPADQYTDQPERFLAAELIREKVMARTTQEVPHSVAVLIDSFDEGDKLIRIRATICVEKEGQKGIVIGRGGASLKQIGTLARKEMEDILGTKIFLELFVKVQENWRDNPHLVRQLDWHLELKRIAGE